MATGLALLVVDVQRDFCPGGALAVKEGDKVVPSLNKVTRAAQNADVPIFFTRDWHPANHLSFKNQGGIWPPHCVKGTKGADFHPDLLIPSSATIISKGDNPRKEAYSGFQGTDLAKRLKALGVSEVLLGGLTTDYCVKESSMDAIRDGFAVDIIKDCTRAVNVKPGDGSRALRTAQKAGAKFVTSSAAIKKLLAGAQHYSHLYPLRGEDEPNHEKRQEHSNLAQRNPQQDGEHRRKSDSEK